MTTAMLLGLFDINIHIIINNSRNDIRLNDFTIVIHLRKFPSISINYIVNTYYIYLFLSYK